MDTELYKIVLMGDAQSGKTSLMRVLKGDSFNDSYLATIGVDFAIVRRNIDNREIKVQIWDSAGQHRFSAISNAYLRGASAVVLVQSLTSEDTTRIKEIYQRGRDSAPNCKFIIVGTKADLVDERMVSLDQMLGLALELDATYLEVSAKEGQGTDGVLDEVLRVVRGQ